MKLKTRRWLFISLIILFVILSVLILFYAAGWRYNRKINSIEKVGSISLNSKPGNANVYLNSELLDERTPVTINNLLPEKYELSIKKEKFRDWQKSVNIIQSQTTHLNDVVLIKKTPNLVPILTDNILLSILSPNKKFLVISTEEIIYVIDTSDGDIAYQMDISKKISDPQWSINSDNLIFNIDNKIININLENTNNPVNISKKFNISSDSFYWSSDENNILFVSTIDGLIRINLYQETVSNVSDNTNIIYNFKNVYFIARDKNLEITNDEFETINSILFNTEYLIKFHRYSSKIVYLHDSISKKVYRFDITSNEIIELNEEINELKFLSSDELLLINNHEIWIWNFKEEEKKLLIRSSEKIIDGILIKNNNYLVYNIKNSDVQIKEVNDFGNNMYNIPIKNVIKYHISNTQDNILVETNDSLYIIPV